MIKILLAKLFETGMNRSPGCFQLLSSVPGGFRAGSGTLDRAQGHSGHLRVTENTPGSGAYPSQTALLVFADQDKTSNTSKAWILMTFGCPPADLKCPRSVFGRIDT